MIISAINGINTANRYKLNKPAAKENPVTNPQENNYTQSTGNYGKALIKNVSFKAIEYVALLAGYLACIGIALYQTDKMDKERAEDERRIKEEKERTINNIRNRYKVNEDDAMKFYYDFLLVAEIPATNDGNEIGLNAVQGYGYEKYKLAMDVVSPIVSTMCKTGIPNKDKIPNGVLLYGPTGSGKTYIAQQLGEHLEYFGANIIDVKLGENHAKNVRAIESAFSTGFYNYEKTGKYSIINFQQDVDNYFLDRKNHPENIKEVRAMMKYGENCAKKGVVWIGTANNPQAIDAAILRPGRTDIKLAIGDMEDFATADMLKYLLFKYGEKDRADDFDYSKVIDFMKETQSVYTPAELELFVSKAKQHKLAENQVFNENLVISEMQQYNQTDFRSLSSEIVERYESDKEFMSELDAKAAEELKKAAEKKAKEEEKAKKAQNNQSENNNSSTV